MDFSHNTNHNYTRDALKISPVHRFVSNFCFGVKRVGKYPPQSEVDKNDNDANLADAIARVAEQNGLSANDVMHIFPLVMRMLKSDSAWAK